MMKRLYLVFVLALFGCSEAAPDQALPPDDLPAEDFEFTTNMKADGVSFNRHTLISDTLFWDEGFLTVADVQAFLEKTPYGTRCFLADFQEGGRSAAQIIVDSARSGGVNPLILLTKLQVEMGLVSKTVSPGAYRVEHALGCACPDGAECSEARAGFTKQMECASGLFADYLAQMLLNGKTFVGWGPGIAKKTLDPLWVTPGNKATAALYTYTPWVADGWGGNWLFWVILQKYQEYILASKPNHHWVGGPCAADADCPYEGGVCIQEAGGGMCSMPCMMYCDDSELPNTSRTFCADLGSQLSGSPEGYCLSRCNEKIYPENKGCRAGYSCIKAWRFHISPEVAQSVCWPEELLDDGVPVYGPQLP